MTKAMEIKLNFSLYFMSLQGKKEKQPKPNNEYKNIKIDQIEPGIFRNGFLQENVSEGNQNRNKNSQQQDSFNSIKA